MDLLTPICKLVDKLCKTVAAARSNKRQCTLIGDRAKRITDELLKLDQTTLKEQLKERPVLKNLELGLTMGADLCSKFSKTSYIRQLAFHAKDKGKFDQVHRHLDTAVQDLTFVIQLDQSSWQERQAAWQQAQADDAQAALDIIEKGLLQGQVSIEKGLLQGQVNLQDSIQKGQVDLQGSVDDIKEDIKEMLRALSEQAESKGEGDRGSTMSLDHRHGQKMTVRTDGDGRYPDPIPTAISAELGNCLKDYVQHLLPDHYLTRVNQFYPPVCVAYATGHRAGLDADGCGPGMFYAKYLIDCLLDAGIYSFSGEHGLLPTACSTMRAHWWGRLALMMFDPLPFDAATHRPL